MGCWIHLSCGKQKGAGDLTKRLLSSITILAVSFFFSFKKSTPGRSISVLVSLLVCRFVLSFIALCYKH